MVKGYIVTVFDIQITPLQVNAQFSISDAVPPYFDFSLNCPGRRKRLSALSVFHSKLILYGAFVWARRALSSQKWWFSAPRAAARLVHDLVTIAKGY